MNKKLQQKLVSMMQEDQRERKEGVVDQESDKKRVKKLKGIIAEHGWPTMSLVGRKGTEAAWLITQHADFDVPFQEQALALLKKTVQKDEAPKHHIAYLTDRILVNKGKPQLYGTQFYRTKDGKMMPRPIKDTQSIDARRKAMKLPPFSEYKKHIEEINS